MPNARDPFELEDGFEDIPVVQKPVQDINKVATSAVKQTAQQVKATTKAFLSQLYGSSSPSATDDDQQADATVDPQAQVQKVQAAQTHAAAAAAQQGIHPTQTHAAAKVQAANPDDEEKLQRARRELQQTHRSEYYVPTFGDITNLESDIRKEAQKRQQQDQQKEQEEEQEKQQMEELQEQKKKEPIAVTRARNKAEMNRGAAG